MSPITVAIVGTGSIARVHVEALQALAHQGAPGDEATVVAVTDIDAAKAEEFGARYGIRSHPTLAGLLAEVPPELVHICTPPGSHASVAIACLRAGASVLVEKPPALSLEEMHAIAAAASEEQNGDGQPANGQRGNGPWFASVFQHRFGSGAQRLKRLIHEGVLGRPLLAVCSTTWFRDQHYFDEPWRGRWETEGGGPTMGHGIHQMDLLAYLLGDWAEISAIVRRQARRMETEDLSMAHVTFASGAVASVINSVLSPREESYLRFDFEKATVELTHLYGYGDDDWRLTPAPGCADNVVAAWNAGPHGISSGHRAQFAEVLRALRENVPPPVTADSALGTMSMVAGIYAAAFGGHPVRPADLGPTSPFYPRMDGNGAGLSALAGVAR
jgi:predicted dehydrogenase